MLRGERGDRWADDPSSRAAWDGQKVELGLSVGVRVAPTCEDDPAVLAGQHRGGGRGKRSQSGHGKNDC